MVLLWYILLVLQEKNYLLFQHKKLLLHNFPQSYLCVYDIIPHPQMKHCFIAGLSINVSRILIKF